MFKFKKILILCMICFLGLTSVCMAADTSNLPQARTTTPSSNTSILNTDVYITEDNAVIENTINGNAFAYGKSITVKGTINGDLLVIGNNVTIDDSATISGNVFLVAGTIYFNGKTTDVYAVGQNFVLDENANITRDIRLYVSQFTWKGSIGRNAYVVAGNIIVEENSSNLIQGNFEYSASKNLNIPKEAVGGEIKFTQMAVEQPNMTQIISGYITSFVNVLVYAIAVVLMITFLTTKFTDKATYCLAKRPFITAGIGILGFVMIPIICIFLIAIGYTMYLGAALLAFYVLALSMTISILGIAIGNFIAKKLKSKTKGKTILFSLASVIAIWLLQLVPVLGTWISVFTVVFGFGILIYSLFIRKDVTI